ncbi:TauD/TfdA family dioxygenase [Streptomyces carpaticus]|uniref:guanitoxin biosynthesis L-enduracididine beta-hydroxylase GntD n=1 Tax=Streptomyces TaxID=1883 RepID=UPI002209B34A|nr:TauD/TfdA family dioxygenase [Streptomyces carpaticus]
MYRVSIEDDEVDQVQQVVREVVKRFPSVEDEDFQRSAPQYAQELPRSLRAGLNTFRLTEPDAVCVVTGYPVEEAGLPPTPAHWRQRTERGTAEHAVYFFLLGCLLGDPVAWATQQDGRVMHDVLPIEGDEHEQTGSSSAVPLTWHTEDAFHPLRTDYVGLLCLRNPESVATTFASVREVVLDPGTARVLREKRFLIRPDHTHLPRNRGESAVHPPEVERLRDLSYEWIVRTDEQPEPVEVLFGDARQPYIRLDPVFMDRAAHDAEAWQALEALGEAIEAALTDHRLAQGEVIFVDNYLAVHGRKPFTARFDGTDRWLKRLNIVRDLRKSRASRLTADARAIF